MLNKFNSTIGNKVKLEIQGSNHDFHANSFRVRVLPNSVVNSKDVNQFKINLDNKIYYIIIKHSHRK